MKSEVNAKSEASLDTGNGILARLGVFLNKSSRTGSSESTTNDTADCHSRQNSGGNVRHIPAIGLHSDNQSFSSGTGDQTVAHGCSIASTSEITAEIEHVRKLTFWSRVVHSCQEFCECQDDADGESVPKQHAEDLEEYLHREGFLLSLNERGLMVTLEELKRVREISRLQQNYSDLQDQKISSLEAIILDQLEKLKTQKEDNRVAGRKMQDVTKFVNEQAVS